MPTANVGRKLRAETEVVAEEQAPVASAKAYKMGGVVVKPFTGKADLPPAKIGKNGRVAQRGEPRFVTQTNGNTVNVIAVYRNGKGIGRRCVSTLKLEGRNGDDHRNQLTRLRKAGVTELA